MLALIDSLKVKPPIDEIVKEFLVKYRGTEEDEEGQESFKEFPMEQFKGKLALHHLEPVPVEREALLEQHLKENRRKEIREIRQPTKTREKAFKERGEGEGEVAAE